MPCSNSRAPGFPILAVFVLAVFRICDPGAALTGAGTILCTNHIFSPFHIWRTVLRPSEILPHRSFGTRTGVSPPDNPRNPDAVLPTPAAALAVSNRVHTRKLPPKMYLLKYVYGLILVREHVQVKGKPKGFLGFGRLHKGILSFFGNTDGFL